MVERLVEFAGHFEDDIIQMDRFCRVCFREFSSSSCPNHLLHHQGHHVAEAELMEAQGGALINIQYIEGWPVVEGGQLPADFVENVQVSFASSAFMIVIWEELISLFGCSQVLQQDGHFYYPIHSRPLHQIDAPAAEGTHPCHRLNCQENMIGVEFCSLRCRHMP